MHLVKPSTTTIAIKVEVMIHMPAGTTTTEAAEEVEAVINEVEDKGFTLVFTEGILDFPVYE